MNGPGSPYTFSRNRRRFLSHYPFDDLKSFASGFITQKECSIAYD